MHSDTLYSSQLTAHAKMLASLTPERETLLTQVGPLFIPHLAVVTDSFYQVLLAIPSAQPYLEGRVELLKNTHMEWMASLFRGPFDQRYTDGIYRVGYAHVRVNLPIEFMAGGTALIGDRLRQLAHQIFADDAERCYEVIGAIQAILSFCLLVMQDSYQSSTLANQLEKFLSITGISKALFNNLASAYRD